MLDLAIFTRWYRLGAEYRKGENPICAIFFFGAARSRGNGLKRHYCRQRGRRL